MLLIVGLGNKGAKYANHRHNVGFMAVDAIHRRNGFGPWRQRFQAETAEGTLAGEKCLLIKPQTFMNASGGAVGEVTRFYKLTVDDILVIHDEVDLPPGKIRMKTGGGVAGHNGLKSTAAAIGPDFRRLRIGVGHPGIRDRVPGYVLRDFSKADADWLDPLLEAIAKYASLLAEGRDSTFANRLHEELAPAKTDRVTRDAAVEKQAKVPQTADTGRAAEHIEGALARGLRRLFGR